jgi:exopolysaccharide biosynthesis protein
MMRKLGADDALNLDGGGSSTLVAREPGEQDVTVQNVPSDGSQRRVANGIGFFSSGG